MYVKIRRVMFVPLAVWALFAAGCNGMEREIITDSVAMFRANPARTGVYPAGGPEKFSAVSWKFKSEDYVYSSPAVSDGIVYFGGTDHCLYAVEINTGWQIWKYSTGSAIWSSPAVSGGLVYFGSGDSYLYAIR